jgi:hypothetical protein
MNSDHQHRRRKSVLIIRRASALSLAVALVGVGLVAPSAGVAPADHREAPPGIVRVHGGTDANSFTLSRSVIRAGQIRFILDTAHPQGMGVWMFKPAEGVALEEVFADFRSIFSGEPAQGLRDLKQDARFYGLAGVVAGHPASVTQTFRPGTYYLLADLGPLTTGGTPQYSTLRVQAQSGHSSDAREDVRTGNHPEDDGSGNHRDDGRNGTIDTKRGVSVLMTRTDGFTSPRHLPARGTISVRNESDELHEMKIFPLEPGTTHQEFQAWLDDGASDDKKPFIEGPSVGLVMISGGRHVRLTYNLPKGTYVMFCEMPDDADGINHIFEGMWKVVTLQ